MSDLYRHAVYSLEADGPGLRKEFTVARQPCGLGWAPDGSLLVVSMRDQRLLRRTETGDTEMIADLAPFSGGPSSDMVVDRLGRAWIGNFGFDFVAREAFAPAALVRVDPGGTVSVAAEQLRFPNGSVITPDGSTLIVGETYGARYTAFTIGELLQC